MMMCKIGHFLYFANVYIH